MKLKIGILSLGIGKGRFTNVLLEYGLCLICDNLLDNEYHFVLYCKALKDAWSKYFGEHSFLDDIEDPTDPAEVCMLLLNSRNLRNTARFLEEMFRIGQSKLYGWDSRENCLLFFHKLLDLNGFKCYVLLNWWGTLSNVITKHYPRLELEWDYPAELSKYLMDISICHTLASMAGHVNASLTGTLSHAVSCGRV